MNFKKELRGMIDKILSHEIILGLGRSFFLKNKMVVLMYHEIGEDRGGADAWTVVKKKDFIRQMEYLAAHFNIISLGEALERMADAENGQREKPSVVITFDDGYSGNYRILLPILKSMGIPVTLFVSTQSIQDRQVYWYDRLINLLQDKRIKSLNLNHLQLEIYQLDGVEGPERWREINRLLSDLKKMEPVIRETTVREILKELNDDEGKKSEMARLSMLTKEELKEMADSPLVTIGAHSHCHNILTQLSEDEIKKSVETSKRLLEGWTNRPIPYFSYPNGDFDGRAVNVLKQAGFVCSMTTEAKAWDKNAAEFAIPRIGVGRYDSIALFKAKVSGIR